MSVGAGKRIDAERALKVYTNSEQLPSKLSADKFTIVDDTKDADVLWLTYHFHDFA